MIRAPEQRADDRRAAAGQKRAAHSDGRDGVELHAKADEIGVGGGVAGDDDQAGDARRSSPLIV